MTALRPTFGHVAVCVKCHMVTKDPVPVRWIERASGPGVTLYACPEHADELAPTALPGMPVSPF